MATLIPQHVGYPMAGAVLTQQPKTQITPTHFPHWIHHVIHGLLRTHSPIVTGGSESWAMGPQLHQEIIRKSSGS
jgi:hypothetical protein